VLPGKIYPVPRRNQEVICDAGSHGRNVKPELGTRINFTGGAGKVAGKNILKVVINRHLRVNKILLSINEIWTTKGFICLCPCIVLSLHIYYSHNTKGVPLL
jgi:hypothetical protein